MDNADYHPGPRFFQKYASCAVLDHAYNREGGRICIHPEFNLGWFVGCFN
jgi:hypothetical protein